MNTDVNSAKQHLDLFSSGKIGLLLNCHWFTLEDWYQWKILIE